MLEHPEFHIDRKFLENHRVKTPHERIHIGVLRPSFAAHVRHCAVRDRTLPAGSRPYPDRRYIAAGKHFPGFGGRVVDHLIDLVEPSVDAGFEPDALLRIEEIAFQLRPKVVLSFIDLLVPTPSLDDLLRPERDQHADDDDSHLAGELAPAVQRLGEVEMHLIAAASRLRREHAAADAAPGKIARFPIVRARRASQGPCAIG